jgi:hypothetical protein
MEAMSDDLEKNQGSDGDAEEDAFSSENLRRSGPALAKLFRVGAVVTTAVVVVAMVFEAVVYFWPPGNASDLIRQAGGVEGVTAEAQGVFENNEHFTVQQLFNPTRMAHLPAFAALGGSVVLVGESNDFPQHIMVRYGNHFHYEYIYIFDTNRTLDVSLPGTFQLSPNILVTKK